MINENLNILLNSDTLPKLLYLSFLSFESKFYAGDLFFDMRNFLMKSGMR